MDIPNAFVGKLIQPTPQELSTALGSAAKAWREFVNWMAVAQGVHDQQWKATSPKSGWSLRLNLNKRTIVYLIPCRGYFQVGFVLGDKAVAAAHKSDLPKSLLRLLDEAPRYAEGTGLRMIVKGTNDLESIRQFAAVKLAN
jgi:hypothetical protein